MMDKVYIGSRRSSRVSTSSSRTPAFFSRNEMLWQVPTVELEGTCIFYLQGHVEL